MANDLKVAADEGEGTSSFQCDRELAHLRKLVQSHAAHHTLYTMFILLCSLLMYSHRVSGSCNPPNSLCERNLSTRWALWYSITLHSQSLYTLLKGCFRGDASTMFQYMSVPIPS